MRKRPRSGVADHMRMMAAVLLEVRADLGDPLDEAAMDIARKGPTLHITGAKTGSRRSATFGWPILRTFYPASRSEKMNEPILPKSNAPSRPSMCFGME